MSRACNDVGLHCVRCCFHGFAMSYTRSSSRSHLSTHPACFATTRLARTIARAAVVSLVATATFTASANTIHVAPNSIGQVLIFPYYTTRSGTVSLISLVNTTTAAKAVRVNVREARRGAVVARINLYLSAKDVWTGAIVNDADGATIITNDTSCTAPAIGSGLPFSNAEFLTDKNPYPGVLYDTRDRTREGYLEIIEMATIPNASPTGMSVTHVAGKPNCVKAGPLADVAFEPAVADLKAPSGGLMGTLSFVNVNKGMLASTPATALDGFWLTGPAAPALRVWAANSGEINLTSGKNTSVAHSAQGSRYISRFANSIDAVSAAMMSDTVSSEYAFTADQVIATTMVMSLPTKPYYVLPAALVIAPPAKPPFQRAWDAGEAKSCDDTQSLSTDREEFVGLSNDDFIRVPTLPSTLASPCFVANPISISYQAGASSTPDQSFLGSILTVHQFASQNQGVTVVSAGKEGGHIQITPINPNAFLTPLESSVLQRNSTGAVVSVPVSATLYGLPIVGFTLSQAAYQTGSPQQNYGDMTPMRSSSKVAVTPQ